MGGFRTDNIFLPLITSITGTAFWLKISKMLAPAIGNNRLVNYISNNTFFIMTHHLTVKSFFIGLLILGKKVGIEALADIDTLQFKASAWYVYTKADWAWTASFFVALFGTVLACFFYERIKKMAKQYISTIIAKKKSFA